MIDNDKKLYRTAFLTSISWMLVGASFIIIPIMILLYRTVDINALDDEAYVTSLMIADSISKVIALGLILYFFRGLIKNEAIAIKNNVIRMIIIVVVGTVSIYLINILLTIIYDLLNITGDSENQTIIEYSLTLPIRPVVVGSILVLAPIFEEFVFRKFLIGFCKTYKMGKWLPYIISIFAFALIHMSFDINDLVFLPAYLALSAVITLGYKYSGDNVYVSIAIHFLNNLLSLILI